MKTLLATFLIMNLLGAPQVEPEKVTFGTLSGFDYSEGMTLPKEIKALDKKVIKVTGFMASEDDTEGEVDCFMIINDACGCEGTPKVNEMIFCAMPDGETTEIRPGNVTITGTLYISEEVEEGVVVSLYTLDVDSIN